MFRLFIFLLFKSINSPYNNINEKSLSKFIAKKDLMQDLISKKKFFHLWRKKLNTQIMNEKDNIKKIRIIKKKGGLILKVKTVHSFKISSNDKCIKSFETLNYIFYIANFKIIDMAVNEYDPEKYKKMLFCGSCLSNPLKYSYNWQELISKIDIILNNYTHYLNKSTKADLYRKNKLYDREQSISYAQKYALKYNPKYTDFNDNGGDCTNFISQCLHAGSLPLSKNWQPYTLPWIRVNELYYFLTRNKFAIEVPNLSLLNKGDIIQFFSNSKGFFTHSGIITDILANGEIFYSCHTYDKLNYPLSEIYPILYTKLRLLKITY